MVVLLLGANVDKSTHTLNNFERHTPKLLVNCRSYRVSHLHHHNTRLRHCEQMDTSDWLNRSSVLHQCLHDEEDNTRKYPIMDEVPKRAPRVIFSDGSHQGTQVDGNIPATDERLTGRSFRRRCRRVQG